MGLDFCVYWLWSLRNVGAGRKIESRVYLGCFVWGGFQFFGYLLIMLFFVWSLFESLSYWFPKNGGSPWIQTWIELWICLFGLGSSKGWRFECLTVFKILNFVVSSTSFVSEFPNGKIPFDGSSHHPINLVGWSPVQTIPTMLCCEFIELFLRI